MKPIILILLITIWGLIMFSCDSYVSLFDGESLTNWKIPDGDNGHWKVADGIIDYDGKSEAEGDKNLWTEKEFANFILKVDWRFPREPVEEEVPIVLPDGSYALNEDSTQKTVKVLDAGDSGIYLRGNSKSQINIWCWPIGSGEIWGYRTDRNMPPEVRRAATPMFNADNPAGRWNRFEITAVGEKVTVAVNGQTVIREARLPGLPERGPIALQHHGDHVQFANIYIKELK